MGAIFFYLELRAQGRTREHRFHKSWRAVNHMLEDAAAIPNSNQPCQFTEVSRATFLMDFSPNKLRIASTHGDHSVRVSNALTGKCTHLLKGHPRTPWCLAFSPTSDDILASGCLNGEIRIWDLMGGGCEVLQNPRGVQVITSLAFHPGGDVLVFATMNYIYFWDWSSGAPFAHKRTSLESERVRWVKYDPYGYYLYTGIENHAGFSRDPMTGEVIISGEVDDAGDASSNREERRNRLLRNYYRDQLLADRYMDGPEERLSFMGDNGRAVVNTGEGASSYWHPNRTFQDSLGNPYRARHRAVANGIGARNPRQPSGLNYFNPPVFPVPYPAGDAFVERGNRAGSIGFDPTYARRGEVQPRQRWGRYEPSFFTRASSHLVSGANSGASSSSHFTSSGYRSGFQQNVAARMNMSSFRQRSQQLRPSLRTNLFPAVPNRSPDASEAGPSFNVLPREASGSRTVDSDEMDEFQIVPVDHGQNRRAVNTRNMHAPSTSSVNESASVSSFQQKQDEYRALLRRYGSRHNEGSAVASSSNTRVNNGSIFSSLLPSAASTGDNSANTRLSAPLLPKQAKSSSLPPEERETHVGPANSVPNLASSALHGTDNDGSFEMAAVNAVSASMSTSEYNANSCESETSDSAASNRIDSLFSDFELLPGASGRSSNIDHSNQNVSIKTVGDLKEINFSEDSIVSIDTSLQIDSGSRCAENIPLSVQNSLSESTEVALCVQDPLAESSSSTAGQQNTSARKSVCSERNSASEQSGSVKCENRKDGSNSIPELKESTENESSNSHSYSGVAENSKDDSLQKYKSLHSKVNTVKLSTARIRLYEAESKRADRSQQNLHSEDQEQPLDGESSTNNNLPQSDVHVGSAHADSLSSSFELTRPESIRHADVASTSRSDDHDIDNPLLRSSVPWHTRVDSWMMRFPVYESSESYRNHIREYLNSLMRPDVTSWLGRSYAVRTALFPPLRQHHNQTWRNNAATHGRHAVDPYVGIDYRNRLSVFQDRQIPRPVADQTSQTLGAMSLPASSDQGTDVVGLNEAPLHLSQTDTDLEQSVFANARLNSTVNSIPGYSRMRVDRAEQAEQHSLNSGSSSASARRPVLGSSASRALRLFTDADPAALEGDQLHSSAELPSGSRPLASSIGFRPVTNGTNSGQPRFHPYSLNPGGDSLQPRALHGSRESLNRLGAGSHTGSSSTSVTSSVLTDSSTPSLHHDGLATPVSVESASRLRQLSESSQRSAFSAFSVSSRETPRSQSRLRTFSSRLNSDSLPHRSHRGAQFGITSQNASGSLVSEHITSQDSAANADAEDLLDSLSNHDDTFRTGVRNLDWQTPGISLGNQVEYLERRVMELDRRLANLEHSYSSRLHEMQQRRRPFMNASDGSGSSAASAVPLVLPVLPSRGFMRLPSGATNRDLQRHVNNRAQYRNSGQVSSERAIPPQIYDDASDEGDEPAGVGERETPFRNRQPLYHYSNGSEWMVLTDSNHGHLDRGSNAHTDNQMESNAIFGGQSHRIQQWDVSKNPVPEILDAKANIIVHHCKLQNDASCNLSQDGCLLAAILPGNRAFMDEVFVAVFSLNRKTLGQCLYSQKFGSHAISLSISPLNRYVLVGLASKRTVLTSSSLMVGQVYKLGEEDSVGKAMKHYKDIYHVYEDARFSYVTVNSARWLPGVGEGLVYGTNRGEMNFFRVESRKVYDKVSLDDKDEESRQRITARNSIATQTTTVSIRRSASTQTANESEERMDVEEAMATQQID